MLAALMLLGACAAPSKNARAAAPVPAPPARPAPQEPPEVKDPNFVLVVDESVPNPDDDGISFTKVFVDGKEAGKTAVGRKSEERALKLKLPPAGNRSRSASSTGSCRPSGSGLASTTRCSRASASCASRTARSPASSCGFPTARRPTR